MLPGRHMSVPPSVRPSRNCPLLPLLVLAAIVVQPGPARALDPLPTVPQWTGQADQDTSFYGWDVNTAGDVNGDGYSDILVGAKNFDHPQVDNPTHTIGNGGLMRLHLGSATGVQAAVAFELRGEGASDENGQVGFACQSAGDVNGDGYDDILVSEPKRDTPGSPPGLEGRVFLFLGGPGGVDPDTAWTYVGDPGSLAELGNCVGAAGDVNGDGYDDVLVSAQDMTISVANQGRVYAFYGSAAGLPAVPSWVLDGPLQSGTLFGFSCRGLGDVNGDGYDDVVIGAPIMNGAVGQAWVYHGSSTGLGNTAAWTVSGDGPGSIYALSANRAGDVNGDGYADLIVGASEAYITRAGRAMVYLGGAGGLSTSPAWTVTGTPGSCFGWSVGTAGDVNGDGHSDLLVGAPDWALDVDPLGDPNPHPGEAFLYLGSASGPQLAPAWSVSGDDDNSTMGRAVATAGDVNGDGFSDVIIGAAGDDNGLELEGQAYVFLGRAASPSTNLAWTSESNQLDARQGSVVVPAGDVNGDGYTDVVVSAPRFDNGEVDEGRVSLHLGSASGVGLSAAWSADGEQAGALFGEAVAPAGDVDGDGYADLIVGAPGYSNGQAAEGQAILFMGRPTPPHFVPGWSAEGNLAGARLGAAVCGIGDINGDGLADVAIGAPGFMVTHADEGRVLVHTGWLTGLSVSPIWIGAGGSPGAGFGATLGAAGDLDADGYSDFAVGAPDADDMFADQGFVRVYRGGPAGVAASPWFTAAGTQAGEALGRSVTGAGDLDGDGHSDLLVGAPGHTGGAAGEGRITLWRGTPAGLVYFDEVLGGQAGAALGTSAAGLPDLNGDGYGDLLAGSPGYDGGNTDEGRIGIYFGTSGGVPAAPDWTFEVNQDGAGLGSAVASGGDLNGDGFVDILAGAPLQNAGQADEGRAMAFFGNAGRGVSRLTSQLRVFSPLRVASLGRSDAAGSFRLQSQGRTAAGRDVVRMEAEVRPLLAPFTGVPQWMTPSTNTGAPQPGTGSQVTLLGTISGLQAGEGYRWRMRFVSGSPFFPRTPWFSHPDNAPGEVDLRAGLALSAVPPDGLRRPALLRVHPNPVGPSSAILVTLAASGPVQLDLFDVLGRRVGGRTETWLEAGEHRLPLLDGVPALAPGIYLARLRQGDRPAGAAKFVVPAGAGSPGTGP